MPVGKRPCPTLEATKWVSHAKGELQERLDSDLRNVSRRAAVSVSRLTICGSISGAGHASYVIPRYLVRWDEFEAK